MTQHIDTIVIGGGQSGLAASYYLQQHGIDHIVLEACRPARQCLAQRSLGFVHPGDAELVFPHAGGGVSGCRSAWLHAAQ